MSYMITVVRVDAFHSIQTRSCRTTYKIYVNEVYDDVHILQEFKRGSYTFYSIQTRSCRTVVLAI